MDPGTSIETVSSDHKEPGKAKTYRKFWILTARRMRTIFGSERSRHVGNTPFLLRAALPRLNGVHPLSLVGDHPAKERRHQTDDLVPISRPDELIVGRWLTFTKDLGCLDSFLLALLLGASAEELLPDAVTEKVTNALEQPQLHHVSVALAPVAHAVLSLGMSGIEHIGFGIRLKVQEIFRSELERHEQFGHGRACVLSVGVGAWGALEQSRGRIDIFTCFVSAEIINKPD